VFGGAESMTPIQKQSEAVLQKMASELGGTVFPIHDTIEALTALQVLLSAFSGTVCMVR
jgi:hypothetical protein